MSHAEGFWVAHDDQRQRINMYATIALDGRFDVLLATVREDLDELGPAEQAQLVVGLVATICSIVEQAADASGESVDEYWRSHLLDVAEMTQRRRHGDDEP